MPIQSLIGRRLSRVVRRVQGRLRPSRRERPRTTPADAVRISPGFGGARELIWIADDFDTPLDDFDVPEDEA